MRRKVIRDFANVFCQRILQLPDGYDLASFAHYGSGIYVLNILSGESSFNGEPIAKLRSCDVFKEWLFVQLDKHSIPHHVVEAARLKIHVIISDMRVERSYKHEFASAHFSFACESEIVTDAKSYVCSMSGEKTWAFDWYYNQLYGSALELPGSLIH